MTTIIIFCYLGLVLCIGVLSNRFFRGTGEDYFVASRSIGPFLLLMSLFGTNMTAFAILGASGEAYHTGIGVFALMPSGAALIIPTSSSSSAPASGRLASATTFSRKYSTSAVAGTPTAWGSCSSSS